MAENSYPGVSIWAHGRSHSQAIHQHWADGGTDVLNGGGGRRREAGMGESTGSGGGAAGTAPTAGPRGRRDSPGVAAVVCVGNPDVRSRGVRAAGGHVGRVRALQGRAPGPASAGAGSPPACPPRSSCARGSRPSVAPTRRLAASQRRPPPAPDLSHRPRRGAPAHTAVPGLPGRRRARGVPRLPPRPGWGRGS